MREWSRPFWTDGTMAALAEEQSLYLIPPYDDGQAAQAVLRGIYGAIFAAELNLWCGDQALWPKPLSFELFEQWFSLQLFPLVNDLGSSPLQRWETEDAFRKRVLDALS